MKHFAFLLVFGVLFSCTNSETELAALQEAEDAQLKKDSIENILVETMDEINKNLETIREKQGLISLNSSSENISKKTQILENISMINSLIDDNRRKIDELTIQARQLGKEKNAMSRIAEQTRQRIIKQEEEINSLKAQLEQESFKVADLNKKVSEMQADNEALAAELTSMTEGNQKLDSDLNKAWFAYGTYDELKEKELVEKKGGVLGVGKKEALSQSFFKNKSYFTEFDIRSTKTIPIHGKKPKLISFHPENSYELKSNPDNDQYSQILIKNPEEFWSTSRFLVVEVR